MKRIFFSSLILAAFCGISHANISDGKLAAFQLRTTLKSIKNLQANFQQRVFGQGGRLQAQSSGYVALAKPRRFYWQIKKPNRQLIVADGHSIYIYEPDLLQVTVKPQKRDSMFTPALLLTVDEVDLAKYYTIALRGNQFTLHAKTDKVAFNEVHLWFTGKNKLTRMELTDGLGQKAEVLLSDVKVNGNVSPSLFQFSPPAGVDVLRSQ